MLAVEVPFGTWAHKAAAERAQAVAVSVHPQRHRA
jgi:hypothetical protein